MNDSITELKKEPTEILEERNLAKQKHDCY